MDDNEPPYAIGYGRPPRASQFKKGQTGNPKGRPKGSKNLATVVLKESRQRVRINGSRGSRMVTKLEAAVMQVGNKAAQGELRAARELFGLIQNSEAEIGPGAVREGIHEADQRVLENLHRRFKSLGAVQPTQPNADPEEGSK